MTVYSLCHIIGASMQRLTRCRRDQNQSSQSAAHFPLQDGTKHLGDVDFIEKMNDASPVCVTLTPM